MPASEDSPENSFHYLPERFFRHPVTIHVIGCGGTGSLLVPRLAPLHHCMLALGHPRGLKVVVWDGDTVSAHNCLRQNFFPPDVGHNKATVMVNRCNIANGLNWEARPMPFTGGDELVDIIIGCVDSKESRRVIDKTVRNKYGITYWIDAGNDAASAQIVVGQHGEKIKDDPNRLPLVTELYPEIIAGEDNDAPSCSAFESIFRQGIATNAMAASWIYAWLSEAFKNGKIAWSGVFFNLETGTAASIPVGRNSVDCLERECC